MHSLNSTAAPKIFMDISAHELLCIRVGTPFKIPATITGRSVPKVTWEFDGKAKTEKKDRLHVLPVDSQVTSFSIFNINRSYFLLNLC